MDAAHYPFRVPDSWTPEQRIRYLENLVSLGVNDGQVCRAAAIIARVFEWEKPERRQFRIADAILQYVQKQVPYVADPADQEWYQGPVYTLAYGGDCEDLAVLVATMAKCAGIQADVYWIDQPEARLNHVVSRIALGGAYLFADASIDTAFLGEHPRSAVQRSQQFERLGLPHTRSPQMSNFAMPTERPGTSYRSSGQAETPAAPPPVVTRPEHGYDPTSADYLREKRIKKELGMKIAGATFVIGVLVGAARGMMR